MNPRQYLLPLGVGALGVFYLAWIAFKGPTYHEKEFNLAEFGALPVVDRGRVKPLDTVARASLIQLSGKQTYKDDDGNRVSAIQWMLDVMTSFREGVGFSGPAASAKVFSISNSQVLSLLKLPERPGFRYAINEFRNRMPEAAEQFARARGVDPKKQDLYDIKLLQFAERLSLFSEIGNLKLPLLIPPAPAAPKDSWEALSPFLEGEADPRSNFFALGYVALLDSYEKNQPATFNKIVERMHGEAEKTLPGYRTAIDFEVFFHRFEPFHQASVLAIFAIIFGCVSWLMAAQSQRDWFLACNAASAVLAVLAFLVATWGLYGRMVILGRPPVINLYSSAVFIGWGCAGMCLILEYFFRKSIALVIGNILIAINFGIIAHYLSLSGDTMEMMQAVLDTNFWLATHVTCITIGYSAAFVPGFIGLAYIGLGLFTNLLRGELNSILNRMMYGVICFAMTVSFTGTVLGGIWADQSWGRFWGWDPKENGALLLVIWNALILHARWGGMIKQRGMAVLAVGGNMVTAWSWFGTNMLPVGLHSYGRIDGVFEFLIGFMISQLIVIAAGLIPLRYWVSFAPQAEKPAPPTTPAKLERRPRMA